MDDKNDIKGKFTVLYRFHLPYRPAFLYRFWKGIREWHNIDAQYGKIHRFLLDNLSISNKLLQELEYNATQNINNALSYLLSIKTNYPKYSHLPLFYINKFN